VVTKFDGIRKRLKYKKERKGENTCFCGCLKTQYNEEEIHGEYCAHMGLQ
jgi:hypothetical protein